ncbi:MAG: YraN family protein [Chloroflexi bacterium]|nr:YraN family protein [Chloroflexota bacterium]MDA1173466.1 YraN family protein [Chloroflexota bacterium]
MPSSKSKLGTQGESIAAAHLEAQGMRIIDRNFHTRYGEVDLIAEEGDAIVFVEVKTRRSAAYGTPEESVTPRKRERLLLTAQTYLQQHELDQRTWRIDVVAIRLQANGPANINHIQAV